MFTDKKPSLVITAAFLIFSLGTIPPLQAAEAPGKTGGAVQKLKPSAVDIYMEKLDKKFDKGALNFVAGWTEIVRRPMLALKDGAKKNKALNFAAALGQGLCLAVSDTLGGFANAFTSLLPQFEIPLPQGGIKTGDITGGEPTGYLPSEPEDFESLQS